MSGFWVQNQKIQYNTTQHDGAAAAAAVTDEWMGHLSGLSCRAHLDERLLGNRRKSFVNMGPLPGVAFAWLVVWGLVFSAGKVTGGEYGVCLFQHRV